MIVLLRAAADVVGYVVSEAASLALNMLAPLPKRQLVELEESQWWVKPVKPKGPRIVEDRGLTVGERDAQWVDKDGDRWRWNPELELWQNKIRKPDISTGWYAVPTENGTASASYAPYTEIIDSSVAPAPSLADDAADRPTPGTFKGGVGHPAPSAVVVAAPASGPPVEVKVPSAAPPDGAGHPSRVNEDAAPILREAAKALRGWTTGQRMVEELLPYWRNVAHCLDIYADECDAHQHAI